MEQKQWSRLFSLMGGSAIELNPPLDGFFGYLLRKKAVKKEDVTKSRIVKEPGNDAILNQRLPADLEERKAILERWNRAASKDDIRSFFIGVNVEEKSGRVMEEYCNLIPESDDDIQLLSEAVIRHVDEVYGRFGYHPYAAVIHGEQVSTGGGLRPFHYHIVMRKNF